MAGTYRTKKTQGKRHRAEVKFTLASDVVKKLAALCKARGLPRSRVIDALVREASE